MGERQLIKSAKAVVQSATRSGWPAMRIVHHTRDVSGAGCPPIVSKAACRQVSWTTKRLSAETPTATKKEQIVMAERSVWPKSTVTIYLP